MEKSDVDRCAFRVFLCGGDWAVTHPGIFLVSAVPRGGRYVIWIKIGSIDVLVRWMM